MSYTTFCCRLPRLELYFPVCKKMRWGPKIKCALGQHNLQDASILLHACRQLRHEVLRRSYETGAFEMILVENGERTCENLAVLSAFLQSTSMATPGAYIKSLDLRLHSHNSSVGKEVLEVDWTPTWDSLRRTRDMLTCVDATVTVTLDVTIWETQRSARGEQSDFDLYGPLTIPLRFGFWSRAMTVRCCRSSIERTKYQIRKRRALEESELDQATMNDCDARCMERALIDFAKLLDCFIDRIDILEQAVVDHSLSERVVPDENPTYPYSPFHLYLV